MEDGKVVMVTSVQDSGRTVPDYSRFYYSGQEPGGILLCSLTFSPSLLLLSYLYDSFTLFLFTTDSLIHPNLAQRIGRVSHPPFPLAFHFNTFATGQLEQSFQNCKSGPVTTVLDCSSFPLPVLFSAFQLHCLFQFLKLVMCLLVSLPGMPF